MKASLKSRRADERRYQLLAHAAALFASKGYAAASVREIVAAAGVTKPVLYYYFGNKAGLFNALMQTALERLREVVAKAAERRGAAQERIRVLAEALYDLAVEELDVTRLFHVMFFTPDHGAPEFDIGAFNQIFESAMADLIRLGIADGSLRNGDQKAMTWTVVAAVYLAIDAELYHPEAAPGRDGLKRMLELIFQGLEARDRQVNSV